LPFEACYWPFGSNQLAVIKSPQVIADKLTIAFHGYGNDAKIFTEWIDDLPKHHALVCIELPGHGDSHWPYQEVLTIEQLWNGLQALMDHYQVKSIQLVGYSLGGRLALTLVEHYPTYIDKMLLIAPDGLRHRTLYRFIGKTWLGQQLLRLILHQYRLVLGLASILNKVGIITDGRYHFYRWHLEKSTSRKALWNRWFIFKNFTPNLWDVKEHIARRHIPVLLVMGAFDKIIKPHWSRTLMRSMHTVECEVFDCGHGLIQKVYQGRYIDYLKKS
jgi:pimeloyl-ACP methyl ester carboxylesterase